MTYHLNPHVRHDFVLLFDVADGNPMVILTVAICLVLMLKPHKDW